MIATATSIMKQLGQLAEDSPAVTDFPPADGSKSSFGKEYLEGGDSAKQD